MNLKEAFRYQNFLDKSMTALANHLAFKANVVCTTQLHKKNAANPEAEDETIEPAVTNVWNATPDQLADTLQYLLTEKAHCAEAVTDAKMEYRKHTGFDLDAELAVNKHRQTIARIFSQLGSHKETKQTIRGTGY